MQQKEIISLVNILASSTLNLNNFTKSKVKTRKIKGNLDIATRDHGRIVYREDMAKGGIQQKNWDDLVLSMLGVVTKVAKTLKMDKIFTEI